MCLYFIVEIISGYITGSLALLADALHMFADVFALVLALFATMFSRKPATPVHTYGFYRTEILTSLANSVILLLVSIFVIFEAYHRIFIPHQIQSFNVFIVASIGLMVNLIGFKLLGDEQLHQNFLHRNSKPHTQDSSEETRSLHIYGARLELLGDILGSIAIISSAILISITNLWLIDPLVSFGLALFIIPRTWLLLRRSVFILMESSPSHLPYAEIKNSILQVKGITGIFDLHIWSITSGIYALSAHVVVFDLNKSHEILLEVNSVLEKKFNITHTTIQIEKYHTINEDY